MEGSIHIRVKFLAAAVLATSAFAFPGPQRAIAQTTQEATNSVVPTIEKLLLQNRSPDRDARLYESSVALFKAMEAGTVPTTRRDLLAKGLYEVAIGGHANAWIDYGRCLWNGWGVKQDREAAIDAYKHAADLGSDYGAYAAAYNLYWTFERYDEAYAYAQQALKGADPEGSVRYLLGLMAYNGRGRTQDKPESLRLHQEAAARGNADALFELFVNAMQGMGDRSKAVFYLQEAAKRDQPRACANLGALYATGQMAGIPRDLAQSVKWYKRAADLGIGRAAAALGAMTLRGEGLAKDPAAAEAYFERGRAGLRCRRLPAENRPAAEDIANIRAARSTLRRNPVPDSCATSAGMTRWMDFHHHDRASSWPSTASVCGMTWMPATSAGITNQSRKTRGRSQLFTFQTARRM
jgi:TPR repeat protein